MALRLELALLLLALTSLTIYSKPMLNEENRNLCEGEENLAECLKEVEEAKKSVKDPVKPETEGKEEDHYEMMMKQEAMIRKMVDENEQNRAYWDEEYKSINKWARYGIQ